MCAFPHFSGHKSLLKQLRLLKASLIGMPCWCNPQGKLFTQHSLRTACQTSVIDKYPLEDFERKESHYISQADKLILPDHLQHLTISCDL